VMGLGVVGSGLLLMLVLVFVGRSNSRSWRESKKQAVRPGELPTSPVRVKSLEAGIKLFTSVLCPKGHSWKVVDESENVRVGDEVVTVLTRRCCMCDAREDRYVKLE